VRALACVLLGAVFTVGMDMSKSNQFRCLVAISLLSKSGRSFLRTIQLILIHFSLSQDPVVRVTSVTTKLDTLPLNLRDS
jgi:hypothetical protein